MSDERWKDQNQEKPYVKYKPLNLKSELKPISKVPGTPPTWEALFLSIRNNQTDAASFTWMRRLLAKYSDEQIWEFYEQWVQNKVHPNLVK